MRPSALRCAAAASLLAAVLACSGSPTEPDRLRGTFRLRAVGNTPLPALADEGTYGSITVLAASLHFERDSVQLERKERWVELGPDGRVTRTRDRVRSERYPYSVQGAQLQIGQPCNIDPAILCAYSETGGVQGSRLSMRVWYSRHEWTYERAGD